jgi:hypothetical protein
LAVDFDVVCAFSLTLAPLGHFKFRRPTKHYPTFYGLRVEHERYSLFEGFYDYPR